MAESNSQVLKKVSDVESNADQESTAIKESNTDQESNSHSSFSAMLKIVEYSDSEHSGSQPKISSSEGHPGAKPLLPKEAYLNVHDTLHKEAAYSIGHPGAEPLSPQKAYFNVPDTLYKEAADFSESETDDEMEGVKSLVDKFLDKSEMEEKFEEKEKPETEDTSADSEWESVKVMETDAYESESCIYTSVESDTSEGELESEYDYEVGDKSGDGEDLSDIKDQDAEKLSDIEKSEEESSDSEVKDKSCGVEKSREDSSDSEVSGDKSEEVEPSKSGEGSSDSEVGGDKSQEVEASNQERIQVTLKSVVINLKMKKRNKIHVKWDITRVT